MTMRQLLLLLLLLGGIAAGGTVYRLRPELVSIETAKRVVDQVKSLSIKEYLPGLENVDEKESQEKHHVYSAEDVEKATQEVLKQKQQQVGRGKADMRKVFSTEVAPAGKKYLYQLEFTNGTGTIADKISFGEGMLSYLSQGGIKVTVPESTVVSLQRIVIPLQEQKKK